MTHAADLAKEYQRLGGKRLAKIDDNMISTRTWDDEPPEAAAFWTEKVEILSEKEQAEVITNLKTITTDR